MVVVRSAAAFWLPMNNNVPQTPPAQPAVGFERHSDILAALGGPSC